MDRENSQTWNVGCSNGWQELECFGGGGGRTRSAGAKIGSREVRVT